MNFRSFIRENREEIDMVIAHRLGESENPRPNDEERRLWVLNDEGLYSWARAHGVKI